MKRTLTLIAAVVLAAACCNNPYEGAIILESQGEFAVGGQVITREGEFDGHKFVGWNEQDEAGQNYRCDHAMVHYQIPVKANKLPLVYVHGFGGSGLCWEATPDGHDGLSTLMLRKRYSAYVMDLPGHGRADRTSATVTVEPVASEQFWFNVWRFGEWPGYNEGVQFATDPDYLDQFFRGCGWDLSGGNVGLQIAAVSALGDKIGDHIQLHHSAGAVPGWFAAASGEHVKAVVSYEPGACVFPESEMPEPIPGLTGGTAGIPIPMEQFMRLTQIPIVLYFGDYIPADVNDVSDKLGNENWRVRLAMSRKFVDCVNAHGGNAQLVILPEIGIYGNTHMLMQDLNNDVLADLLDKWITQNKLK